MRYIDCLFWFIITSITEYLRVVKLIVYNNIYGTILNLFKKFKNSELEEGK